MSRRDERQPLIKFVDLQGQHDEIRAEIDAAVSAVIDSGQFVLGPEVQAFEREFAEACGTKHAVGTDSGTSALRLALRSLGIGQGHEVITVSLTFWATTAAILEVGAVPVLVDVDSETCNIDVSMIEAAITPRTKAIVPVHLYGRCADMDPILEIAERYGIHVVEDAAQAAGSTYKGRPAGSLGHMACFSFYPAKNLGALGDAGAVVTDDAAFAERLRVLRDHGAPKKYTHETLGYNSRLDEIQAAVLRVKLPYLKQWNERRRSAARLYRQIVEGVDVFPEDDGQNYHLFPVLSPARDGIRRHLSQAGIETGIHYPIPVHLQPAYLHAGLAPMELPHTEQICARTLSLPMHSQLSEWHVKLVADAIREYSELPKAARESLSSA